MRQNIYLHFMNRDARDIIGLFSQLTPDAHRSLMTRALNAATLLCEQYTVMPPGFFLECELAYDVVSAKKALIDAGLIILPRRELSLEKLIEKKRSEYSSVRDKFEGLFDDKRVRIFSESQPIFIKRETKIGQSATQSWEEGPDVKNDWKQLKATLSAGAIENARSAPRVLLQNGQALTWAALQPLLTQEVLHNEELVRTFLQRNYFTLYMDEFELVVMRDLPVFLDEFYLPSLGAQYSYNYLFNALKVLDLAWLIDAPADVLARLKVSDKSIKFFDCFVQLAAKSGSLTNMLSFLGRARDALRVPAVETTNHTAVQTEGGNAGPRPRSETEVLDVMGAVADLLTTEHDLLVRTCPNADASDASNKFTPWKNAAAQKSSGGRAKSIMKPLKTIAVATANIREMRAVLEVLKSAVLPSGVPPKPVGRLTLVPRYEAVLPTSHGSVRVIVAQAEETGSAEAVNLLRRIVQEFHPDAVFFVGCAALLDEKEKPSANMVYVARRAIDSDKVELKDDNRLYDMEQQPGDLFIRRAIANLAAGGYFDPINVKTNRDFISGSAFVGDRNAQKRKDLVDEFHGDAVVVEMEAFAVYKEMFFMRSEGYGPSVTVMKGISDFGDEAAQTNKADTQRVATTNAANVLVRFLIETAG